MSKGWLKLNTSNKTPHPSNFSSLRSSPSVAPLPAVHAQRPRPLALISYIQSISKSLLWLYFQNIPEPDHFFHFHSFYSPSQTSPLIPLHPPRSSGFHSCPITSIVPLYCQSGDFTHRAVQAGNRGTLWTPLSLSPSRSDACCGSSFFSQLQAPDSHHTGLLADPHRNLVLCLQALVSKPWCWLKAPALVNSYSAHTSNPGSCP